MPKHASAFGGTIDPLVAFGKTCSILRQRLRLLPREFRAQLQASLHVFLRPAEADAVAEFFDPEGNGYVDGESFMRWFFQAKNRYREVGPIFRSREHRSRARDCFVDAAFTNRLFLVLLLPIAIASKSSAKIHKLHARDYLVAVDNPGRLHE